MKCSICNQEIILIPSASERAKRCGGKPSDYIKLFTTHDTCALEKRKADTSALMQKLSITRTLWNS